MTCFTLFLCFLASSFTSKWHEFPKALISIKAVAQLFIVNMFSKHSILSHVTCDHGSEFIFRFFYLLGEALNIHIHFTSGYHPEADGQTERVNQTLEQYLHTYCNYQQDNWALLLPLTEFAYNNTPHASTGVSPFFANKGYNSSITVYPDRDIASERARDLVIDLDALHQKLRQNIAAAQSRYQGPRDAHCTPPPPLEVSQEVFVKEKYFRTTRPSRKLSNWYEGSFKVIAQPGP